MPNNDKKDHSPDTRIEKYKNLRSKINNNFSNLQKTNIELDPNNNSDEIDYFKSENYLLLSQKITDLHKRLQFIAPYFEFVTPNKNDSVENSLKFLISKNNNIIHSNDIKEPCEINYSTLNKIIQFQEKELHTDQEIITKNKELSFDNNKDHLKHIINELINNSATLSENIIQKRNELLELLFNIIKEKESKTQNSIKLSELKKRYYGLINHDTRQLKADNLIAKPKKINPKFVKKLLLFSIFTFIITLILLLLYLLM